MSNNQIEPGFAEPPALSPGPAPGPPVRRPRRWGRVVALTLLSLLGLGALGVGGSVLTLELTRKPTAAEVEAAGTRELASRWRIRTAGEIFLPTVEYSIAPNGLVVDDKADPDVTVRLRARRVGIAASTGCAQALDKEAAEVLLKHGCRALLRATYVDASGTLVTTIGVAVLPDRDAAAGVEAGFSDIGGSKRQYGLRPIGFPGTVAERFGDAQRQAVWLGNNGTPYVFLRASGWTDGRTRVTERELVEEFDFAGEVTDKVIAAFVRTDEPCEARGVRC